MCHNSHLRHEMLLFRVQRVEARVPSSILWYLQCRQSLESGSNLKIEISTIQMIPDAILTNPMTHIFVNWNAIWLAHTCKAILVNFSAGSSNNDRTCFVPFAPQVNVCTQLGTEKFRWYHWKYILQFYQIIFTIWTLFITLLRWYMTSVQWNLTHHMSILGTEEAGEGDLTKVRWNFSKIGNICNGMFELIFLKIPLNIGWYLIDAWLSHSEDASIYIHAGILNTELY